MGWGNRAKWPTEIERNCRSPRMTAGVGATDMLEIPRDILDAMIAHCVREAPLECCGILCGIPPRVSLFYSLRNDMKSETRYNADPRDLIAAHREFRRHGAEILAIYHSHPRWQAIPSQTDLAENHYGPVPRIIVSLLGDSLDVRVWRLDTDCFEEVPWRIVEPRELPSQPQPD
jgi:[CysO sulfur-carrier protein]-S-L-cysteine hydrolase